MYLKPNYSDFLGWDCAHKSLAQTHVSINIAIIRDLYEVSIGLLSDDIKVVTDTINVMDKMLSEFMIYRSVSVCDVLCGVNMKDVSEVDRCHAIHKYLMSMPTVDPTTTVIIERQNRVGVVVNVPSIMVSSQLMYFYISRGINTTLINPKSKNKLTLGPGLSLKELEEIELPRHKTPRAAKYTARKNHTKLNFTHLLAVFGQLGVIKGIKKTYLDDVSDSAMEIFAYINENNIWVI